MAVTSKEKLPRGKRPRGGASIPCPRCGSPSKVIDTRRSGSEVGAVQRRRKCLSKGHYFDSEEKVK